MVTYVSRLLFASTNPPPPPPPPPPTTASPLLHPPLLSVPWQIDTLTEMWFSCCLSPMKQHSFPLLTSSLWPPLPSSHPLVPTNLFSAGIKLNQGALFFNHLVHIKVTHERRRKGGRGQRRDKSPWLLASTMLLIWIPPYIADRRAEWCPWWSVVFVAPRMNSKDPGDTFFSFCLWLQSYLERYVWEWRNFEGGHQVRPLDVVYQRSHQVKEHWRYGVTAGHNTKHRQAGRFFGGGGWVKRMGQTFFFLACSAWVKPRSLCFWKPFNSSCTQLRKDHLENILSPDS